MPLAKQSKPILSEAGTISTATAGHQRHTWCSMATVVCSTSSVQVAKGVCLVQPGGIDNAMARSRTCQCLKLQVATTACARN
eukprot:1754928-Amphidinium_carterae.1